MQKKRKWVWRSHLLWNLLFKLCWMLNVFSGIKNQFWLKMVAGKSFRSGWHGGLATERSWVLSQLPPVYSTTNFQVLLDSWKLKKFGNFWVAEKNSVLCQRKKNRTSSWFQVSLCWNFSFGNVMNFLIRRMWTF